MCDLKIVDKSKIPSGNPDYYSGLKAFNSTVASTFATTFTTIFTSTTQHMKQQFHFPATSQGTPPALLTGQMETTPPKPSVRGKSKTTVTLTHCATSPATITSTTQCWECHFVQNIMYSVSLISTGVSIISTGERPKFSRFSNYDTFCPKIIDFKIKI